MKSTPVLKVVLSSYFLLNLFNISYSQSCPTCSTNATYNSNILDVDGNPRPGDRWSINAIPGPANNVLFNRPNNYVWDPPATTTISGIVLSNNANLTLDKGSEGNTSSFNIIGGCIVVNSGSTLTIRFISELRNVSICIESGGKLVFDARRTDRNRYTFDNVDINLGGPDAEIDFGNATIIVEEGGVRIGGYEGNGCDDPNGNIRSTNPISADDVCLFFGIAGLPVEYLYFKSTFQPQLRAVQLNWATAKEWENSHFEIQRAVNGVRNWEKIGEVKGAGWSEMPVEYSFTDEMLPLTGGNIFYRLKQVDFNGDFAYSEVVSARVPSLQFTNGVWRVFPNPTNGDAFRIELLDTKRYNGEAIQANLITPAAGRKSLLGSNTASIAEEVLELLNANGKGVYILEIAWSNKVEHIKILKQ